MDTAGSAFAWHPEAVHLERSRLLRFARRHGCAGVEDLRRKGAADPAWFWEAMVERPGRDLDTAPAGRPGRQRAGCPGPAGSPAPA